MTESDWDRLFDGIKRRYGELRDGSSCRRQSFLMHVENLASWDAGKPPDAVEDERVKFPDNVHVAFATCHVDCGAAEFIVEGSTQECQRCGRTLFRHVTREYQLKSA